MNFFPEEVLTTANITKVMKYELIYLDGAGEFHDLQNKLWLLQRQTREILNKTIQEMYIADFQRVKFDENALYHRFRNEYPIMASKTVSSTLHTANNKYTSARKDVLVGTMSLPSFKRDQPILIHNEGVRKLKEDVNGYTVSLSMFSTSCKEQFNIDQPRFKLIVKDNTQSVILQRLIRKEYKIDQCQLSYKAPKWFLNVTYSFTPEEKSVDPNKVLGVDLGCAYAVYASSYGNHGIFKIPGDEISAFEKKQAAIQNRTPKSPLERIEELEERRYAKQQQARYCGEGRIGHGTKTRVATVYKDADKIARFQDTINHRYSRAIIDYAVKNGYGTIQIEDLSGIKENTGFPRRLRHWTYFDLQTKLENKAAENGITVRKIKPKYTSQRCSKCGYIDSANRMSQSEFKCIKCGYKTNADFNASQNISIPVIEKLIEETLKEQSANAKQS